MNSKIGFLLRQTATEFEPACITQLIQVGLLRRRLETVNEFGFRRFSEDFWSIFDSFLRGNIRNVDITPQKRIENWLKKL